MPRETYRFLDYELDTARFELRLRGEQVPIEPRAFDVLHHLIRHHQRVVAKEELLDVVWGSRFVSQAALTTALRTVRAAIGDSGEQQEVIRTARGRGYRFVAPVLADVTAPEPAASTPPGLAEDDDARQTIRYCQARDGARIAYASTGSGPTLVKAANWMTHLDLEWSSPVWGHWLRGLSRDRTLVRYDERGCGLSEWDPPSFSFDDWVEDLHSVVEAAGVERFPLLGVSQGGAVAIAYAVRHPERVSHLVLAGAYARGRLVRSRTDIERAEAALDLDLARVGWARKDATYLQVFASQFLPDASPEERSDFIGFQHRTTSPINAVRFLEEFARIDVASLLGQVQCPTLILHARDDLRVPGSQATELAAGIPDSRLALLDSGNHLLTSAEPAWPAFLAEIDAFLAA